MTMKKALILCGIVAAFLFAAQKANAQYLPTQIHRDGSSFVDERGRTLSDSELIDAIGTNIFEETVVGARKQYNAGRKLLISGIAGLGVGIAGMVGGAAIVAAAGPHEKENNEIVFDDEDKAMTGAAVVLLGTVATALGGTALTVGIPLKAIGQGRLNWVEDDYNGRQGYTLHIGTAPSGVGLTLSF